MKTSNEINSCNFTIYFHSYFSWSDVIDSSPTTMKHFRLYFDNSKDASCEVGDIVLLRRKFKAMQMDLGSNHGISAKALSIITSHHGKNIQELAICSYHGPADIFLNIFKNFPLLEELNVFESFFSGKPGTNARFCLPYLKTLYFNESYTSLLDYISAPALIKLEIEEEKKIGIGSENWIKFVQTCENLEELDLGARTLWYKCSKEDLMNFSFKLKKLSTEVWYYPESNQKNEEFNVAFTKFMLNQATSLKELHLLWDCDGIRNTALFDVILTQLTQLEKLTLNPWQNHLPRNKEFYDALKPLKNIKEFELSSTHTHFMEEFMWKGILAIFPNLTSFVCHNNFIPGLLSFMAINNPKVETLNIVNIDAATEFKRLKNLHVNIISDDEKFFEFLAVNPTIENVQLANLKDEKMSEKCVEKLLGQPKLVQLCFGGQDENELQKIYDLIEVDRKQLKSLEILLYDLTDGFNYSVFKKFTSADFSENYARHGLALGRNY
jgi:hypothetical protein